MRIRDIYKWLVLRVKKIRRKHPAYLILDGDWLNNNVDKEV